MSIGAYCQQYQNTGLAGLKNFEMTAICAGRQNNRERIEGFVWLSG
jgi:hypothetical protein